MIAGGRASLPEHELGRIGAGPPVRELAGNFQGEPVTGQRLRALRKRPNPFRGHLKHGPSAHRHGRTEVRRDGVPGACPGYGCKLLRLKCQRVMVERCVGGEIESPQVTSLGTAAEHVRFGEEHLTQPGEGGTSKGEMAGGHESECVLIVPDGSLIAGTEPPSVGLFASASTSGSFA